MRVFLIGALLFLVGCGAYAPRYTPPHGDYLIHVRSLNYIQALHRRVGGSKEVGAFTILGSDPCQVYIAAEYWDYLIEHEIRHCKEGAYHKP